VIVVPAVSDEEARAQFDEFEAMLPYLRTVHPPIATSA
jgi:hypothetical protein